MHQPPHHLTSFMNCTALHGHASCDDKLCGMMQAWRKRIGSTRLACTSCQSPEGVAMGQTQALPCPIGHQPTPLQHMCAHCWAKPRWLWARQVGAQKSMKHVNKGLALLTLHKQCNFTCASLLESGRPGICQAVKVYWQALVGQCISLDTCVTSRRLQL